jgi:hypothetical protein
MGIVQTIRRREQQLRRHAADARAGRAELAALDQHRVRAR